MSKKALLRWMICCMKTLQMHPPIKPCAACPVFLAAELLHALLPLPVPASIYGMILMLALLATGAVKLEKVKRAGGYLLEIMPVMFIPAAVGLLEIITDMKGALLPIAGVIVLTTIIVMAATGRTAQWIMDREAAKKR